MKAVTKVALGAVGVTVLGCGGLVVAAAVATTSAKVSPTYGSIPDPGVAPSTNAPVQPVAQKVIYTLSGSGIKKTAGFNTPGEWTLSYQFDCSKWGSTGNFQVLEFDKDGNPVDILVNELDNKGTSTTAQHADAGGRYLEVNSECKWSLNVIG